MAQKSQTRFAKMDRLRSNRRVQIEDSKPTRYDDDEEEEVNSYGSIKLRPSEKNITEDQEPFMGVKVRRKASLHRDYKGDYLDVPSYPFLMKVIAKQGELCCLIRLIFCWFGFIAVVGDEECGRGAKLKF